MTCFQRNDEEPSAFIRDLHLVGELSTENACAILDDRQGAGEHSPILPDYHDSSPYYNNNNSPVATQQPRARTITDLTYDSAPNRARPTTTTTTTTSSTTSSQDERSYERSSRRPTSPQINALIGKVDSYLKDTSG